MASQVSLEGVSWDIDPDAYTPVEAVRRGSVHRILSENPAEPGGTVYQDGGVHGSDHIITLSGFFTEEATMLAVFALYRQKGAVLTFQDFLDNEFEVVFTPGTASFRCEKLKGSASAFRYTMSLSVVSITSWYGSSYPNP